MVPGTFVPNLAGTEQCATVLLHCFVVKHDTVRGYADIKTSLLTYERFETLRSNTDLLLAHHMQQAHYTWRQQERFMNLTQEIERSYQQKTTLYWDAST